MIEEGSKFNVLVVEDDYSDFSLIRDLLSERFNAATIIHATTVADAESYLKSKNRPDVVLFDLRTPQFVLNFKVSIGNLLSVCPMIVLTDDQDVGSMAMESGASDYLLKNDITSLHLYKCITYSIERKNNLERIRKSEEKYRNLFQLSPIPKWIYDLTTFKFLQVNDAAIAKYGYSNAEFLNMTIMDIRPKEDYERTAAAINLVKQHKGNKWEKGFRHFKKNGELIYVQIESTDVQFEDRTARLVLSVDITEMLDSQMALSKSEQRFKSLIQEAGDLISILSPQGVFLYCSPNHLSILGYDCEELVGRKIEELIHPVDYLSAADLYRKLLNKERVFTSLFRFKHKDGHWVYIESIATNALEDDAVSGFVINSRDVSVRIQNEKRIQETNERFEAIAKATSDAIYDFDFKTENIHISGSNYHSLFGYNFENHTTNLQFFKSCIHPDDREVLFDFLKKSTLEPQEAHFEVEYRFLKKDGDYANIFDRFNILWNNGVPVRKIGAMQDISTKKLQQTILAFEKEIYELYANPKVAFEIVIDKLSTNIELLIPDIFCSIFSVNDDLTLDQIAGRPLDKRFSKAVSDLYNDPEVDSHGQALFNGQSVFNPDIENDPLWHSFLYHIKPYGFKSCWSVPVSNRSGKVVAALAGYFTTNRHAKVEETDLIERAANLIGVLIENRRAIEQTELAKERYDIVAKATSDTIWDWQIQDDNFIWNKGILGIFGYQKEQIGQTSKWWFDRVHPEDSIRVSVKLYNFLEEKVEKWQDEYRFACADGSYKYVFDRGFLVKDEEGKPVRMIGAMQDVTRQKEEEQRLKLFETVITQTKDTVVITEVEKSNKGIPRIVFVNPAFTQMTGYDFKEVVGKSPSVFMGRSAIGGQVAKLSEALKNKKEFKFETLNKRKNGEPYWINFSMIPITNKENEHSHWISIQRDITDEKKQEKEKEQLIRELTQNNKDLKQFSYITSHNLRAPLSNLTGLLNLVEDIPVENDELREILNGFSKSTHLLNETINDLVKVVIIKDNPSIQKEEVLIKDVFENVFNQLSFLIGLHKPIIKIELEKVSILNINKAYLESILLNLMTNAIKYRAANRQLKIFISSKEEGSNNVLIFKDNGIGIDLVRNADKIFGLYQRFHNYPDSKGLGLYLVKSQVETMGGTIAVQSEVNKGTTFTLTFKNK